MRDDPGRVTTFVDEIAAACATVLGDHVDELPREEFRVRFVSVR